MPFCSPGTVFKRTSFAHPATIWLSVFAAGQTRTPWPPFAFGTNIWCVLSTFVAVDKSTAVAVLFASIFMSTMLTSPFANKALTTSFGPSVSLTKVMAKLFEFCDPSATGVLVKESFGVNFLTVVDVGAVNLDVVATEPAADK